MTIKKRKIVITGGHLTPALAVIDELDNWQIIFFGRKKSSEAEKTISVEAEIIPEKEIPFIPIITGRLTRQLNRHTFKTWLKIPIGILQAFYWLLRLKPNIVLSFGGYVSVPVVLAAWGLRIPVVTHEQTTVKGLATRINVRFAQKIAISWPQTASEFPKDKVVLTGNPIRKEIFRVDKEIWQTLAFDKFLPLVFITGGNQGSHLINETVRKALPELVKKYNLFHQSGHLSASGDFEKLSESREKLPNKLKAHYHVKKYLNVEEMGTLLNKADLVISRAGANTLTELAALGKPSLLVPLPWLYQNEQGKNAQMMVDLGIAEILDQKELSVKKLITGIEKMMANLKIYQKNSFQAKKMIKHDSAKRIVTLVEETARAD